MKQDKESLEKVKKLIEKSKKKYGKDIEESLLYSVYKGYELEKEEPKKRK